MAIYTLSMNKNSLLLKANRLLGAELVQKNVVELNDLETANGHFLEDLQRVERRKLSLLKIMLYDLQILKEEDLIHYQMEEVGLGFCRLSSYSMSSEALESADLDICWATRTVPFDRVEGFWFLASSYYLSPVVKNYWEETLDDTIIWYAAELSEITAILESLTPDTEAEMEISEEKEEEAVVAVAV